MTRRAFAKASAAAGASAPFASCLRQGEFGGLAQPLRADDRPSFVVILIDDAGRLPTAVRAVESLSWPGFEILHTPGHTPNHSSLLFQWEGQAVLLAGDAVATRNHWRDNRGSFDAADPEQASRTIAQLKTRADIVVPGHDNAFASQRSARSASSAHREPHS